MFKKNVWQIILPFCRNISSCICLFFVKCALFCTIVYYVQDFCTCSCDIYIVVFCNRVNSLWLLFGMLYFKDLPAAHVKEERTIRSVQSCRSDH